MDFHPIKTKRDYLEALKQAEAVWNAPEGSKEVDRLEVLALLIQDYEARHHPIPDPDPIDFLHHVMEARGLTRKDMEPYIGSPARVAEGAQQGAAPNAGDDSAAISRPQPAERRLP
jgi:HTH-type transcriptional regulator/antitoxin HigA